MGHINRLAKLSFIDKQLHAFRNFQEFTLLVICALFGVFFLLIGLSIWSFPNIPSDLGSTITLLNSAVIAVAICVLGTYFSLFGLPIKSLKGVLYTLAWVLVQLSLLVVVLFYSTILIKPQFYLKAVLDFNPLLNYGIAVIFICITARTILLLYKKDIRKLGEMWFGKGVFA